MSVWYLELDDEITDAVARLRAAKDDRVVFVVPAGSRIGTGRINFRLLAREAEQRGLHIALVSGDVQVRGLAASAGLPTYATVGESERGEQAEREARAAGRVPGAVAPIEGSAAPVVGTGSTAIVSTAPGPGGTRLPTVPPRPPRSRRRQALLAVGALALVGVMGGGALFAVYQSVPTATIRLVLRAEPFGPERLDLSVSPTDPTNPAAGVIQGVPQAIELTASVPITATQPIDLARSSRGSVTFTNTSDATVPIPEERIVATESGIKFETQDVVEVPANGTASVDIRAVERGTAGNVDAGAIRVIEDAAIAAQLGGGGGVTNLEATTGGQDSDSMQFSQADYDAAVEELRRQLEAQLITAVPRESPPGYVAYPGTGAQSRDITVDQARGDIVGRLGPETTLSGSLPATVLTADSATIDAVARQILAARAQPGTLLSDPVITLGEPTIADGHVTYAATGEGSVFELKATEDDLKQQVRNRTIPEAEDILDDYGQVTITLSPDFLPTLPDDPNRIRLEVQPPEPGAPPEP